MEILNDTEVITNKETRLLISELQNQMKDVQNQLATAQQQIAVLPPIIPSPTPQAVNQIRNGTYSHSVGSWNNDATADDRRYECAWWYSHPIQDAQPLYSNTVPTLLTLTFAPGDVNTGTNEITITNHWLDTGMGFQLTTTGTLPAPLVVATTYFIIKIDANTVQFAATDDDARAGTPIDLTTTGTVVQTVHYDYTVKNSSHSYYSSAVTDWDWVTGSVRPENLWSLDALIPGNNIEPGYSFYAIFDCVRANQYITAASGTRIFCGLYHHSTGDGWEFIQAPFEITATPAGTAVVTPVTRKYLIKVSTDRGFSVISSVLTDASAPSDADFGNGSRVVLNWKNVLNFGVQTYDLYRNTEATFTAADVNTVTDKITIAAHPFSTGTTVSLTTTTTLPTPLVAGTIYYVIKTGVNDIQLAATASDASHGTQINITAAGAGTDTISSYVLLKTITTGLTTYIDNNSFTSTATAFPTADFNELIAYTSSIPDVLATIPYAGDPLSPLWATLPFAIRVPQNYDKSDSILADGQWLRWGLTAALDFQTPTDCTATFNSNDFTSPTSLFTADMLGLSVTITWKGSFILNTTITVVDSATEIHTLANWTFTTNSASTIYVHGGGFQGLYIDLAHMTYVAGAAFSPNGEDISPSRGLPPVTPNGTTQGGSGQGGGGTGGDGDPVCLYEEETVSTADGDVLAKNLKKGMMLPNGFGKFNQITEIRLGVSDVWYLETESGVTLKCTETKKVYTSKTKKTVVKHLQKGDNVLVMIDGQLTRSPITNKSLILKRQVVVQVSLSPKHSFLAGSDGGYVLVDNLKPILPFQ